MEIKRACFITMGTCVLSFQAMAASIVIQNSDGVNEGFNDPNSPVHANQKGNNSGTTLGQMRLKVFQAAADRWGELLNSNITITIDAQFNDDLGCSQFSGALGFAGANSSRANFGAGMADTAYPISLAESLRNANINGGSVEVTATFNSEVDSGNVGCLGGGGFYYGLDDNAPVGTAHLFPVVLHELAHGLGFGSLTDVGTGGTGAFSGAGGFPDTFSRNLHDLETGKPWDAMSNAERLASSVNDPDLVWKGARTTADRAMYLGPATELVINAPGGITGTYPAELGAEPTIALPDNGVTADMVDGDPLGDSCQPIDSAAMNGKIVLFDLPPSNPPDPNGCPPVVPAFYSEFQNAVAVVIANTEVEGLPDMSAQIANEVTMPYVGVTMAVGNDLRTNMATANVTIRRSPDILAGENQGMVRMHAPDVFEDGSSVSHWTAQAQPDVLMKPVLGGLAFEEVDLTLSAFKDIGWSVNIPGADPEVILEDGFED
jgi:hypothetical protein